MDNGAPVAKKRDEPTHDIEQQFILRMPPVSFLKFRILILLVTAIKFQLQLRLFVGSCNGPSA